MKFEIKEIGLPITKEKVESFLITAGIQYQKKSDNEKSIIQLVNSNGVKLEFTSTSVQTMFNGLFVICDYERIVQFSFSKNKNEFFIFGTGCIISFKL